MKRFLVFLAAMLLAPAVSAAVQPGDRLHCSRPQFHGDTRHGCLTWARWIWDNIALKSSPAASR